MSMKILVADDDPVSRRLLKHVLEKQKYEVIVVDDGLAAWDVLTSDPSLSLAIIDWMMPGLEGVELVRRIRSSEFDNYVYTILLTAKTDMQDIVYGLDAGADDYLTKPFNRRELRARLRAGERILKLERNLAEKNKLLEYTNKELSHANHLMKQDLEAAGEIQKTLLPNEVPRIPGINIEWLFRPSRELAGDIFNIFKLDEKHYGLYLLDVSGHGVSAALLAVTLSKILSPLNDDSSIVRRKTSKSEYELVPPAEVAAQLNRRFAVNAESGQYFTCVYGLLDIENRLLTFISAGHPDTIIVSQGDVVSLKNTGPPIGISPDAVYLEKSITLKDGDRLFIHSDGINEALKRGEGEEQFGQERLTKSLVDTQNESLRNSIDGMFEQVQAWTETTQHDDISLLAIEIRE